MRVGHIDLHSRRVRQAKDDPEALPAAMAALSAVVKHTIFREFLPILEGGGVQSQLTAEHCLALADSSADKLAHMVSQWMRVGFSQGNFNADNCLVGGRTMDYGPFGFMDNYDPAFAKWTGSGEHFAFMNQPQAAFVNWQTLMNTLAPLIFHLGGTGDQITESVERAAGVFEEALKSTWRSKLGLPDEHTSTDLFNRFEALLRRSEADYTIAWRQLASVVDIAEAGKKDEDEELVACMEVAFGTISDPDSIIRRDLLVWLRDWLSVLEEAYSEEGQFRTVAPKLRLTNPKFVPREWMLVAAYNAASKGDLTLVMELNHLFEDPYAEQSEELSRKYYRRAALEDLSRPGTAFMT